MALVLVFCGSLVGSPLLLLGASPLLLVRTVPCTRASVGGALAAGIGFLLAMGSVLALVLARVGQEDSAFAALLWSLAWCAVAPGSALSFGLLWGRIAAKEHPGLLPLYGLIATVPWLLMFGLLVMPWHSLSLASAAAAFGLSALIVPSGIMLAAFLAKKRAASLALAHR
jgi:hypothetical protein